jgi:leucyl aminopeptidase (aminopeptidase T)
MQSIEHLLKHCGSLVKGEKAFILCDASTKNIANVFLKHVKDITTNAKLIQIPLAKTHGEEPPSEAIYEMLQSDLIISLCKYSLAHSQARIDAGKNGARFLSLPLYDFKLLKDPSVVFDFKSQAPIVRFVADAFTNGKVTRVTSSQGTDITLIIAGRTGNYCPGFVDSTILLGSPPDIEANISPLEEKSEGIIVVDGSITCPEIGLLSSFVTLTIYKGKITNFASNNELYTKILDEMFEGKDSKKRILAEIGVGLNPIAKLTGTMLTDEGALGCVHFGFGSNYTTGGINRINFHLDFVIKEPSLFIDKKPIIINGKVNEQIN